MEKASLRIAQKQLTSTSDIGPGLAVKILRAAAEEDNEDLQRRWAELMATALDPNGGMVSKSHVAALEKMMPHDARVFDVLIKRRVNWFIPASKRMQERMHKWICRETGFSEDVLKAALGNLKHLGLVSDMTLATTAFGGSLWTICTPPDAITVEDPELDAEWGEYEKRARAAKASRSDPGLDWLDTEG